MIARRLVITGLVVASMLAASPAEAARCGNAEAGLSAWLEAFGSEAVSRGISRSVVSTALGGITYDTRVIRRDRNTNVLRSLATLAHDCRWSDFFSNELLSALQIVQRGDISAGLLKGR